jgi:hypothetical protein
MSAKRVREKAPGPESSPQFQRISENTAEIVRTAAEILNEDLAAGIVAARQMQRRFKEERRIDPQDFRAAVSKLQVDSHGLVSLLEGQLREMQSEKNAELMQRLVGQSHGLIDIVFDLATTAAEVANQLLQSAPGKPQSKRGTQASD